VKLAFYLVYLPIYAGFLLHRSHDPAVLFYSRRYLVLLLLLALPLGLPPFLKYLRVRRGLARRQILLALAPALTLLALLYLAAMQVYYYRQEHRFDPFLQVAPARPPERAPAEAGGALRVLALGGAMTQCAQLPEAARYTTRLQGRLTALRGGTAVEVLNAGRLWHTTRHSLIGYVSDYQDWRPDVVVVMHAADDLARSFSPSRYAFGPYDERYAHFYGAAAPGARPPTFEAHWLRRLAHLPLWSYWYSAIFPTYREVDYALERYVSLAAFEGNLRRLAAAIRGSGATPVLVTEPSLYKGEMGEAERRALKLPRMLCNTARGFGRYDVPSAASLSLALSAFNGRVRAIAAEEGAVLADAEAQVPKDLRHFVDDRHLTAQGADAVAAVVAEAIAPAALGDAANAPPPDPN
jgi:hypothetical protein